MDENGRSYIGTVMEKSHNTGIVEILRSNVIANLYAEMPAQHAAAEFLAGRVNVLQRYLAEGLQSAFPPATKIERSVVE